MSLPTISPRADAVFQWLTKHNIPFNCYAHPEGKTIEEAKQWWKALVDMAVVHGNGSRDILGGVYGEH